MVATPAIFLLVGLVCSCLIVRSFRFTFEDCRADPDVCPACWYSRVGLAKGACCPECGSAAPGDDHPPPRLSRRPGHVLLMLGVPVPLLGALYTPEALVPGAVVWIIAVGPLWLLLDRVISRVPRAEARVLAGALLVPAGLVVLVTLSQMSLAMTARIPGAGPGTGMHMDLWMYVYGPYLCLALGVWSFCFAALFVEPYQGIEALEADHRVDTEAAQPRQ